MRCDPVRGSAGRRRSRCGAWSAAPGRGGGRSGDRPATTPDGRRRRSRTSFKDPSSEAGKEVEVMPARPSGTPAEGPLEGPGEPVRTVLEAAEIGRALTRIAHEMIERNKGADDLVAARHPDPRGAAGPAAGGPPRRIAGRDGPGRVARTSPCTATTCVASPPAASPRRELPAGGIDDSVVVLVDDVLYSGRTVRAALDALRTWGGPPPSNWRCSSTAAIASCRSAPTTSARTCPPRPARLIAVCLSGEDGLDEVQIRELEE